MSFRQRLFIQKRIMQNISSSIARSRTQLARLLLSSEWRRLRSLEWTVRNSGNKTISNCWKDLVCMVPVVIYATCTEHLYYDYDIIELFRIIIELYWNSCVYVFDTAVSKRTQFLYIHNNSNDNMIYTCPMYWTWIEGAGERERERYVHVYCNIAIATLYHCHFILRIQHLVHHMSSCTAPAIVWTIRIYLLYLFIWYGKVFDFICYLCILESSAVFKSPSTHPCTPATHISTQPPNHQSQRFVVFPSFLS